MSEYISREAAKNYVIGRYDDQLGFITMEDIIDQLDYVPAADVRPVVRCRECKHWSEHPEGYLGVCSFISRNFVMENGYCAWGERKEDDHE